MDSPTIAPARHVDPAAIERELAALWQQAVAGKLTQDGAADDAAADDDCIATGVCHEEGSIGSALSDWQDLRSAPSAGTIIPATTARRHSTTSFTLVLWLSWPEVPVTVTTYVVALAVVTLIGVLCADVPAESLAATAKLYCVPGESPVRL